VLKEKVLFQEFDCEEEANKKEEFCVVRDSGGREIGDVVRYRPQFQCREFSATFVTCF